MDISIYIFEILSNQDIYICIFLSNVLACHVFTLETISRNTITYIIIYIYVLFTFHFVIDYYSIHILFILFITYMSSTERQVPCEVFNDLIQFEFRNEECVCECGCISYPIRTVTGQFVPLQLRTFTTSYHFGQLVPFILVSSYLLNQSLRTFL